MKRFIPDELIFRVFSLSIALISLQSAWAADKCPLHMTEVQQALLSEFRLNARDSMATNRELYLPITRELLTRVRSQTGENLQETIERIRSSHALTEGIPYGTDLNTLSIVDPTAAEAVRGMKSTMDYNASKNSETVFGEFNDRFTGSFKKFKLLPSKGAHSPEFEALQSKDPFGSVSFTQGLVYQSLTPIGSYGDQFADSLIMTNAVLRALSLEDLKPRNDDLFARFKSFLMKESGRRGSKDATIIAATYEGILSATQTFAVLLPEPIPGVAGYREALEKIVQPRTGAYGTSIFVEYVQRLAAGVVAPLTLMGRYYEHPLALNRNSGYLELDRGLVTTLTDLRKKQLGLLDEFTLKKQPIQSVTGMGCPLGFSKGTPDPVSGIQYLGEAYVKLFLQVDAILHPTPVR